MKPVLLKESEASIQYQEDGDGILSSAAGRASVSIEEEIQPDLRKSSSWLTAGGSVIGLLAGLQIIDSLIAAFEVSRLFGWILATAIGVLLAVLAKQVVVEYSKLRQQKQWEKLKRKLALSNHPSSHGAALPLIKESHEQRFHTDPGELARFLERAAVCQDDSEILYLYSKEVLAPRDQQARELVIRHSSDCALMVAVSPFAAVDMGLVLWRNLKMLNDIGQLYGMPNSPFSRFKVLKRVLRNMMLVGAQELVMDAAFESMSVSLGSKLSARAAQGLGAGLISMRIGLKAMDYCRPIAFMPDEQPRISQLRGEIITQVTGRLMKAGTGNNSVG
jgi:putative membrane protein